MDSSRRIPEERNDMSNYPQQRSLLVTANKQADQSLENLPSLPPPGPDLDFLQRTSQE